MAAALAQVRKGDDVTCLLVVGALVRDPYLDLRDLYAARDIGNGLHRLLVVVAEIMAQEEMAVLVVRVAADVEPRHLCAALAAHRLRFTVLLRYQGLDLQLAELQIRLDTEERLAAADKRRG